MVGKLGWLPRLNRFALPRGSPPNKSLDARRDSSSLNYRFLFHVVAAARPRQLDRYAASR